MSIALALLLLPVTIGGLLFAVLRELKIRRREVALQHAVVTFGPALAAVDADPRQLLVWHPLASIERRLMPEVFAELDQASGGRFPFAQAVVHAAHTRWTAQWLSWERAHDAEYKLRAAQLEAEAEGRGESGWPITRARIEAVDREKLERYQQRYEEYIRIAKALAALEADR